MNSSARLMNQWPNVSHFTLAQQALPAGYPESLLSHRFTPYAQEQSSE